MGVLNKRIDEQLGGISQLTIGQVVDTNDPHQMGRIKVSCPLFGDFEDDKIGDLPWATPVSPLAGTSVSIARGRENDKSIGPVAYGMFNVPKIGAFVLVGLLDNDPRFRIYLGCVHDQFLTHTMPHGRYTYFKNAKLTDEPSGPLTSAEHALEPLYSTQTTAFTVSQDNISLGLPSAPRKNYEYRTRGADVGTSGIDSYYINTDDVIFTTVADDKEKSFNEADGNTIINSQGYHKERVIEGGFSDITGNTYDPQVYAWTTPGFHAFSMSDSSNNCRIRIRSTHGHQVILDDTNERVYISTANGRTWLEMDESGNIDIYGQRNISVHAEKDINFTAGETFRVKAKNGIHLMTDGEMRLHSQQKTHIRSNGSIDLYTDDYMDMTVNKDFRITSNQNIHLNATTGVLDLYSNGNMNLATVSEFRAQSGGQLNLKAGGNLVGEGSQIHWNSFPATTADVASLTIPSNTYDAFLTSRIPEHEPWARMMTNPAKTDQPHGNTHIGAGEFTSYDDPNIGKQERGVLILRNPNWHR